MTVKKAIDNMLDRNLDEMRQNLNDALVSKAIGALEERKQQIAQNYLAQPTAKE
jgi:hypothetical protein